MVAGGWFFAQGLRTALPVLLPHISDEFGLRLAAGGVLMSVMFVSYALGQLPGGILGDRYGERAVLVGSVLLMALGVVVVGSLQSFASLVVGVVALSFGCGTFAPMRFTILSDLYPDRDGTAQGIVLAVGDIGNTTVPPVAGAIAALVTWRLGIGFSVPMLIVIAAGLWFTLPRRTAPTGGTDKLSLDMLRNTYEDLTRQRVLLAIAVLFSVSFIFQGQVGLYPTYLVVQKGLTETTAGIMLGLFFGCSVLIHVVSGASVDRFSEKPVLVIQFGVGAIGFVLLPLVHTVLGIVIVTILLSVTIGAFTVSITYLIEALGEDGRGTILGLIRTLYISVAALSPALIGFLGDVGHFDLGFVVLGLLAALCMGISWWLPPAV